MTAETRRRRRPRPMTHDRLKRSAIHYLQRFPSSVRHFRTIMERKIKRAHGECPGDEADYAEWLKAVEADCLQLGLLNDELLAEALARSFNRRGSAIRQIRQRLRQKGFQADCIDRSVRSLELTVSEDRGVNTDLYGALRYAKRRRFGPFSRGESDWKVRQKQMASLARRGFTYDVARTVIEMEADDERLDILD